jgi:hypothetical protein
MEELLVGMKVVLMVDQLDNLWGCLMVELTDDLSDIESEKNLVDWKVKSLDYCEAVGWDIYLDKLKVV